jgi:hypothetical protein
MKNMNPERMRNITKGCNGFKYTKILKREQWVRYLEKTHTNNQQAKKNKTNCSPGSPMSGSHQKNYGQSSHP